MVPFLLICCDCGGAPGGGAGFEPVPECSDGAIHTWAIEGPQPEPHDVSAKSKNEIWGLTKILSPDVPYNDKNYTICSSWVARKERKSFVPQNSVEVTRQDKNEIQLLS